MDSASETCVKQQTCVTRSICNSLVRLSLYKMVFKEMKNAHGDVIHLDSIPLPQSLFQATATDFPISASHVMLEEYADKMLSEVVALLLFEGGVDKAESSVITTLRLLIKQSIFNVGRFLSRCHCHFQTQEEYSVSRYGLQPGLGKSLHALQSTVEGNTIPAAISSKTQEATPSPEQYRKEKKQSNDLLLSADTQMILTRFFFSKHISLYSIILYIQKRLSLYKRLMDIESGIVSIYPEVLKKPSLLETIDWGEAFDKKRLTDLLKSTYKEEEEGDDGDSIFKALSAFYSQCNSLLNKQRMHYTQTEYHSGNEHRTPKRTSTPPVQ